MDISVKIPVLTPCVVKFTLNSHSQIIREPFIQFWINIFIYLVGLDASVSQFIKHKDNLLLHKHKASLLLHKHWIVSVFCSSIPYMWWNSSVLSGESFVSIEYRDISVGFIDGSVELCPLVFEIFLTLNVEVAIQTTFTTKTSSISLSSCVWFPKPNCFLAPGSSSARHVIQMAFKKHCRPVQPQRGVVLLSFAQTMEWMWN